MRRLVLFDIDGTLLSAAGAGKRAIHDAMMDVYGTTGAIGSYSFAGRTDPEIVRELLGGVGWEWPAVEERLDALWAAYLENLARDIRKADVRPLPGVLALLERIEDEGGEVVPGLLTGNVAGGARIKVDAAGIGFDRFRVGAYGSDHADRPELPAIAARRAREATGVDYRGREVVVIGDTPLDIRCGDALGVRTIAVATGSYAVDELAPHRPDHLFGDLSDAEAVWRAISEG